VEPNRSAKSRGCVFRFWGGLSITPRGYMEINFVPEGRTARRGGQAQWGGWPGGRPGPVPRALLDTQKYMGNKFVPEGRTARSGGQAKWEGRPSPVPRTLLDTQEYMEIGQARSHARSRIDRNIWKSTSSRKGGRPGGTARPRGGDGQGVGRAQSHARLAVGD